MIIKTLVENTTLSSEYGCKHGLSFYIETSRHKILFDLGANGLFLKNAEKLNVDISMVDAVIISHGHRDHGGALKLFLQNNTKAKIYLRENAFEKYTTKILGLHFDVGLDRTLKEHPQITLTKERTVIDEDLQLFSDIRTHDFQAVSNNALYVQKGNVYLSDDFSHEQNLIIKDGEKYVLIAGCAHNGIVNIQRQAEMIVGRKIDVCIGGFHLYNPTSKKQETPQLIMNIANELKQGKTVYYTCHCTGKNAYHIMKEILSERIGYLSAGCILNL